MPTDPQSMIRIGVVVGSTRPHRRAENVARWVADSAAAHPAFVAGEAEVEVVDLADHGLPLLDEPVPAVVGDYRHPHTLRWAETVRRLDGFAFVVPEYNHSYPAALKNAIDYLYAEWHDKGAGFVSYGVDGGMRAVEHLRPVMAELKIADVSTQVALGLFTDFQLDGIGDVGTVTPTPRQQAALTAMLDELLAWSRALKPLRGGAVPEPAVA